MSEPSLDPANIDDTTNEGKKVSNESVESSENLTLKEEIADVEVPVETDETLTETLPEQSSTEQSDPTPSDEINEIEQLDDEQSILDYDGDFSTYSKKDYVELADKMLAAMSDRNLSISDVKNIDNVTKVVRAAYDDMILEEKSDAKKAYVAENGSEEGYEFRNDNHSIRIESIFIQIRDKKHAFFQKLEQQKEDYFEVKTRLLQQLREIVDTEEKGESKNNWEAFKSLQAEWKNAGNVNSPHNGSLWSGYNALVDRYFDIRSIQNELKDLDRKKNIESKEAVVEKIEEIAVTLQTNPLSNAVLAKANELLGEYKHIGPGPREVQDQLWSRLKKAFDVIYDKKRELQKENTELSDEVYNAKSQLLTGLETYLTFSSDSINEWNAKTKEVMAIQDQWNALKGGMPREKGKEVSKHFWAALKQFFKNKSDFFAKLEAKRTANLDAKTALIKQAGEIVESGDFTAPNTNKIIELQKKWKTIGHVPEKFKESLFGEFKTICDSFFDGKRKENSAQDAEFAKNLEDKKAICEEIEKLTEGGSTNLSLLSDFKKKFSAIGFVPRKDMKSIQERFINAINSYVKVSTGTDKSQKEKMILQNEAESVIKSGGNLSKTENDIRRKIKTLEDEITLTKNNLEFFGNSKNADKLRQEYQKKIDKSEEQLADLQSKLQVIIAAY